MDGAPHRDRAARHARNHRAVRYRDGHFRAGPRGDLRADNQLRRPDHQRGRSSTALSDNPFDASAWRLVSDIDKSFGDLTDITYHRHVADATVRVAFNRPEVRNAFRPHTVDELYRALDHARMSPDVGVVLL